MQPETSFALSAPFRLCNSLLGHAAGQRWAPRHTVAERTRSCLTMASRTSTAVLAHEDRNPKLLTSQADFHFHFHWGASGAGWHGLASNMAAPWWTASGCRTTLPPPSLG